MKIATYNIQSLFHRHIDLMEKNRTLKARSWREEFDRLLAMDEKSNSQLRRLRELSELLEFNKSEGAPTISMKNIDGNLFVRSAFEPKEMKASPLTNWNGNIRLSSMPISKRSFQNKAKVIVEADAEVLILQEVESRNSLVQLNREYLVDKMASPYKSIFHMAGNDCKGMGMGLFLKEGFYLKSIKTFANELDEQANFKFENDLQLYKIELKEGGCICIINCHFTSIDLRNELLMKWRKNQLHRVSEVYGELRDKGYENIVVSGTLNVPSYSDIISPILQQTDLKNSIRHFTFLTEQDEGVDADYYRIGAYGKGVNMEQHDYLLFSPALFHRIYGSGLNRKAIWPLTKPQWNIYDSIQNEKDAASDHPLIWANLSFKDSIRLVRKSA